MAHSALLGAAKRDHHARASSAFFRPAARAGTIGYRIQTFCISLALALVLHARPAIAQDTAGVGVIRGTVTAADGRPAADVAVCVSAAGRCVVTHIDGTFVIADLRPDRYTLEIVAAQRPPLSTTVTVRAGVDAVLAVTLPDPTALTETVVVSAPVFVAADEVKTSGFLAAGREVAQDAGALQDISRFVQTLPGAVIGTDDFRNDLIVRGGSPLENLYIVDNVEIPNINTFATFASAGGTVSMIDAGLLQDATFLTGGFPSIYGNRASSVLQIALREGSRERTSSRVTFGFAGAGGIAEGPVAGGRGSWIVSARRSVLDFVTEDVGIGGVPVLYTLNGKILFDASPRDRLWLLNVSGVDRVRLGAAAESDPASELSNVDITYRGIRHATGFNWQRTFGDKGVGLLSAAYARASVNQRVIDLIRNGLPAPDASLEDQIAAGQQVFRETSSEADVTLKYDLTTHAGAAGKLQAGVYSRRTGIDYDAASPFGNEGPYFLEPETNPFTVRETRATFSGGGYAQLSRSFARRIGVTAGLRGDRYGYLSAARFAPRVGVNIDMTPRLSVRASAGRFYQAPLLVFVTAFPESRLEPFRADHLVAGVSVTLGRDTRFTLEAYSKRYARYPVSIDVPQLSLANIGDTFAVREVLFPMVPEGRGAAIGAEAFIERKPSRSARWYGQANLAVSRTRFAGRDGVQRPGSFDYPIVANATGTYRAGANWEVSMRTSLLGGRPFTPIDEIASAEARRMVYYLDRVNSERGPAYFRVDLRVDRRWVLNGRPLSIFAGAQNVTNRKNVSGYSWDRRSGGIRVREQLGLFPIAGFDWQF